jgi:hypothetical protein
MKRKEGYKDPHGGGVKEQSRQTKFSLEALSSFCTAFVRVVESDESRETEN